MRAWLLGALPALVVFIWLLTAGSYRLFDPQFQGGFYDAQAHAFLAGHLDVPPAALNVEGFVVGGRTYEYYGPVPALLRLPVAAATDRLDGRLTVPSMLLAFVVMLVMAARLQWAIRRLSRAGPDLSRREAVLTGLLAFAVATGPPLYLASRAWVYHEAEMWGFALALATFDQLVRFLLDGGWSRLAGAAAFAAAAMLSRASVGGGAVASLGVLAVIGIATCRPAVERVQRTRLGPRWPSPRRWRATRSVPVWALVAAFLVPLGLYAAVNFAKFRTPFGLPMEKQRVSQFDAHRKEMLRRNDGHYFGTQFVPTAVLQYARPDALGVDRLFPFVAFPAKRAPVIGDVYFDLRERSSSLPDSAPLLTVLGIAGLVVIARRRQRRRGPPLANGSDADLAGGAGADLRVLWVPWLGAVAGTAATVSIGYISNRYLIDLLPLVLIPAFAAVADARLDRRRAWPPRRWRLLVGGAAVLAVAGVVVNLGLGLWYQRAYSQALSDHQRAWLIDVQAHVDDALHGGATPNLRRGAKLPPSAADGDLYVIGDCAGTYWSDGDDWLAVERTAAAGYHRLDVRFGTDRRARTLVVFAGGSDRLIVEPVGATRWRVVRLRPGAKTAGPTFTAGTGTKRIDVITDPALPQFDVHLGGQELFGDIVPPPDPGHLADDAAVHEQPFTPTLCRYLTSRH